MKKKSNTGRAYIETHLSKNKQLLEVFIAGIKHETRLPEHNELDNFNFQKCKKVDSIHQLGTVYLHEEYGYVANGYMWYRFRFKDLILLSN
jgi:hypothetical protein